MDYRNETAYVIGGGDRSPLSDANGNPILNPQVFLQSQLNNGMSGTDANAIYQATHDQGYAADYNQPYMQEFLTDLVNMGLTPYRGQQRPDTSGSFVTGAGAYMMPSSIGTEQVLPQGTGSWEGLPANMMPNDQQMGQLYADVLNAIMQNPNTPNTNAPAIGKEMLMTKNGIL